MTGTSGGIRAGSWRVAGTFAAVAVLLAACGGQGTDDRGADGVAGGTDTGGSGGASELVVAMAESDDMQWDPRLDNEKTSIHFGDTLVDLDRDSSEFVPALAESWELSEDGTTWTFKLRPDVRFHGDWGTVTAEDVKFSWGEWIAEDSEHAPGFVAAMRDAVDGDLEKNFEIVDDLEFKLHTTKPVVALPSFLCSCATGMTVTSKRYFDETPREEANAHPIGTAPWQYVSSDPGVEVVMEAIDWEHAWRETPAYDRLRLQAIPDGAARLAQVRSGAAHVAQTAPGLTGEAIAAGLEIVGIENQGHVDLILGGMYFGHEALDSDAPWIQGDSPDSPEGKAIREALSLAIDRELILDRILFGEGRLTYAPLFQYNENADMVDDSWELPEYDPERAKELLAEGGYPDGFPIELMLFNAEVDMVGMGEAIAGMWEEIGIDVTLTPTEEDLVDERMVEPNTDGIAFIRANQYYNEGAPTWTNYLNDDSEDHKFFHPAIEEGYDQIVSEPDYETRMEIFREVAGELKDDFIPINLMAADMTFVLADSVESFEPYGAVNTVNSLETVRPRE